MESDSPACLFGSLVIQGVAATWSRLDCFGPKWVFSLAHSPHPLSEMVLAGEQPWGVGGGEIWFGAETESRTQVSLILSPEGEQEEPGDPFFTWSFSVHDGVVSSAPWHRRLVCFFRA